MIMLPILFAAAVFAANEWGGEVVVLETQSADGRSFETSLWIVEFDRGIWLRAGRRDSDWIARLRENPQVFLNREGKRSEHRAEIREELAQRVNAEMREKYGLADLLVSTLHDSAGVLAVRLGRP